MRGCHRRSRCNTRSRLAREKYRGPDGLNSSRLARSRCLLGCCVFSARIFSDLRPFVSRRGFSPCTPGVESRLQGLRCRFAAAAFLSSRTGCGGPELGSYPRVRKAECRCKSASCCARLSGLAALSVPFCCERARCFRSSTATRSSAFPTILFVWSGLPLFPSRILRERILGLSSCRTSSKRVQSN